MKNPSLADKFDMDLRRYFTRKIGFEAVMRIRCTRGTLNMILIQIPVETNKVKNGHYLMRQDNTIYKFSIKLSFKV